MTSLLEPVFLELVGRHNTNSKLSHKLWTELNNAYSGKSRHYHTLSHLEHMLTVLQNVKPAIADWDTILFALYYHDAVYAVTSIKNEEDSAALAKQRLNEITYPHEQVDKCACLVLATKQHMRTNDSDTNYFTDADLSILGQSWEMYLNYTKQIRKEYAFYPDMLYRPGRRKVLKHFLSMPRIYKTPWFFDKLEQQAKQNMENELKML